ncbi:MAG: hypothetical protein JXN64_03110 [Spirochaetes bacterium]|nr:hypothetical protein [Spirochaetota bacterium]
MQRKVIITLTGLGIIILLGIIITLSCGPRYGYYHMYDDPEYGYDGMMGQGYGRGRMMRPGYGYREYNHLGFMSSELKLKEEQERQIYDLAFAYRTEYFENRGNVQELEKLEQQHRMDIEKILTPEQKKIYEKYKRGFDRYGWFGGCPYHR